MMRLTHSEDQRALPDIDKCTAKIPKTKRFGKPWETLATVGPISSHLERAIFRLINRHEFLGAYLHWFGLAALSACSADMPGWIATTCSDALDFINTRLTTSSVCTGKVCVKWSRSQTRPLDK
ncbi:hypothetical protein TNCV_3259231 [Trichonephila clavipes]|nr:hypothetical protein TNCV_3259231 [Trichonephila clavipes]